jgi:DNA-binding transcriptional ArsR family regulator
MENTGRQVKDVLYAQVTRIGKAMCSPKRLELIELLCQGEKPVERLAKEAGISMKLASAHLKELRQAHLVGARRDGKNIYYRLTSDAVADFWVAMRALAEDRLLELRAALAKLAEHAHELMPMEREELLAQAEQGEVVVLDVRPGQRICCRPSALRPFPAAGGIAATAGGTAPGQTGGGLLPGAVLPDGGGGGGVPAPARLPGHPLRGRRGRVARPRPAGGERIHLKGSTLKFLISITHPAHTG